MVGLGPLFGPLSGPLFGSSFGPILNPPLTGPGGVGLGDFPYNFDGLDSFNGLEPSSGPSVLDGDRDDDSSWA